MKIRTLVCLLISFNIGLTPLAFSQNAAGDEFVVVLDAGHGGRDPGAMSNGVKEKDIALDVALLLGKALEDIPDIKVIYTRKTDRFIELWRRADIANKADADLFLSLHCNSSPSPGPYGTETWVLGDQNEARNFEFAKRENEVIFLEDNYEENYRGFDPNSPESSIALGIEQNIYVEHSINVANKIENSFVKNAKRKSRGLKQHNLLVIRNTYMPSVLVELGFINNKKEAAFLNSKSGQSKMSNALKLAVTEFKNELEQNVGDSFYDKPDNTTYAEQNNADSVQFRVQLAASSRKLKTKAYNFKGLEPLSRVASGRLYKYFYGETTNYETALTLKEEAISKGYESAFLVAFKDGKIVPLNSVLKSQSN